MIEVAAQAAAQMACEAVGRVADRNLRLLIPEATEPMKLSQEQNRVVAESAVDTASALGDHMVALFSLLLPKVLLELQRADSHP